MKYYITLINDIIDFGIENEIITFAEDLGYWIDNRFLLLDHFFNEKLVNKILNKWDFLGGENKPKLFKNKNELKEYIFKCLINYLECEADFLKTEVENYENLKDWDQK